VFRCHTSVFVPVTRFGHASVFLVYLSCIFQVAAVRTCIGNFLGSSVELEPLSSSEDTCFMLVSCMSYSSTLKMKATCYSETSVDCQWTTEHYIPEERTFYNHCCVNIKSCKRRGFVFVIHWFESESLIFSPFAVILGDHKSVII
jgi:hypothetical protein